MLPGVAFTKSGARLGHGKGFYDSFISKHLRWSREKGLNRPSLIAVALKEQIIDELPLEEHDQALDGVVTGNGKCWRPER